MSQRRAIAWLTCSLLCLATMADAAERPNVLLIILDDLNAWVGHLGTHPGVQTPNIDRLAQRGVSFTRAYAAAPACNPSRAAMLSGRRPTTSGVYENGQPWLPVLGDAITLPQHFMRNGYHVMGAGKIFHATAGHDTGSWHEYFTQPPDPTPAVSPMNGFSTDLFDWGPLDVSAEKMADHTVASWAIAQLERQQQQPFFLAVGLYKPHLPWHLPRSYFARFPDERIVLPETTDDDLSDVPPLGVTMADPGGDHAKVIKTHQWKRAVQGYLAALAFADDEVGRILGALAASAYRNNTVVVLMGDNGFHLGEKQHWRKFALWEEATHTPLIIVAPGITTAGSRCDHPVDLMSVYPTLAELAGLPLPRTVEGHSLVPLLRQPDAAWPWPALTTHGRGNQAVRLDAYRYIRYRDGTEELYDHRTDPHEWTNLARDPGTATLRATLASHLAQSEAPDAPRSGVQ